MDSLGPHIKKNTRPGYCLPKTARLCARKSITALFATTHQQALKKYPLRLIWLYGDPKSQSGGLQALFVVPRRSFKKAVSRNQIRRRIKEVYRLNLHLAGSFSSGPVCNLAIIYTAREILPYQIIETKLIWLLKRFAETRLDAANSDTNLSSEPIPKVK